MGLFPMRIVTKSIKQLIMNSEGNILKSSNPQKISAEQKLSLSFDLWSQSEHQPQSANSASIQAKQPTGTESPRQSAPFLTLDPPSSPAKNVSPQALASALQSMAQNMGEGSSSRPKEIKRRILAQQKDVMKNLKKIQKFFKNRAGEISQETVMQLYHVRERAVELLRKNNSQ